MANFNKIILVGNLTRDPQLKYLPSQVAVCDFGLAVNHKYKTKEGEGREEVLFIDCTCFGRGGEVISQYCQKGKQLMVEGRLRYESWEDKQGGGKRSKHSVTVDNFQLLGGPQQGGGSGESAGAFGGGQQQRPQQRQQQNRGQQSRPPQQQVERPFDEHQEFSEADIPF